MVSLSLGRISDDATVSGSSVSSTGRDDGARDGVTLIGDDNANTFDVSSNGSFVRVQRESGFRLEVGDETIGIDTLQIEGRGSGDTFTISGPVDGNRNSPGERLKMTFVGESGNDTFNSPIGAAVLVGSSGTDSVTFAVRAGDPTNLQLSRQRVAAGSLRTDIANRVERVTIDADVAVDVRVQSTLTNRTDLDLNAGGNVDVLTTAGRLDIDLQGDGTIDVTRTSARLDVNLGGNAGEMANVILNRTDHHFTE